MIPETPLRISPKAAKSKNEMVNIWHYSEQNTRSSDTSNSLMKFTWEIIKAWFLHVRKILCEIAKCEKPNEARYNLWNQDKTEGG